MPKDSQSRKWQLTQNNPQSNGLTHEAIRAKLGELKCLYWCMGDEIGLDTKTPHTHIFIMLKSPARFSRIKKLFPEAHIEQARGTAQENKDYVAKSGKWADDPKADTSVEGTFEESGELPYEPGPGFRSDIAELYELVVSGLDNASIMAVNPELARYVHTMDKIRQDILESENRDEWRDLDVTYIFGPTATGKSRGVMEKHGYAEVCRIVDYKHPFEGYMAQSVICFDEFRSSLPVGDMLEYLDGYPLSLPARYANRQALYTTVYIISNIDLGQQFPKVQEQEPATWRAFLRRIHHVVEYRKDGPPINHGPALDYIFPPLPDWVKEAQDAEQMELPQ